MIGKKLNGDPGPGTSVCSFFVKGIWTGSIAKPHFCLPLVKKAVQIWLTFRARKPVTRQKYFWNLANGNLPYSQGLSKKLQLND